MSKLIWTIMDPEDVAQDLPDLFSHELSYGPLDFVTQSPHGDYLACGFKGGLVAIIDTDTWAIHKELHKHKWRITSLHFSETGRFLATTSVDNTCNIWDLGKSDIDALIYSFDAGSNVAGARVSEAGTLRVLLWTFQDETTYFELDTNGTEIKHPKVVPSLAQLTDACFRKHVYASTGSSVLSVRSVDDFEVIASVKVQGRVRELRVSRQGTFLACITDQWHVLLFRLDARGCTLTLSQHLADPQAANIWSSVCFSSDERYVLASGSSSRVYVWDISSRELVNAYDLDENDNLSMMHWTPYRPGFLGLSKLTNRIYVWDLDIEQRWINLFPRTGFIDMPHMDYGPEQEEAFDARPFTFKTRPDPADDVEIDIYTMDTDEGDFVALFDGCSVSVLPPTN